MAFPKIVFDHLARELSGDLSDEIEILKSYSHDASLFEILPALVVYPKNSADIQKLVSIVNLYKKDYPDLSITVRAAGTCMSGGPLNNSIVVDIVKYMQGEVVVNGNEAETLSGTFYRDFDRETLKTNQILPSFTASRELNTIGGMIGNNSGGEKNLRFGKTEKYIRKMNVVLADGLEYEIRPVSKLQLEGLMAQDNFLGQIYRQIFNLIETNKEIIQKAKPEVSKNSAGYYLWNVWDGEIFDLNKLIVGAQGTLGITTKATLGLVPVEKHSRLLVLFLPSLKEVGQIVKTLLKFDPDSIESYDNHTFKLAIRFLPQLAKKMNIKNLGRLMLSFWPEFKMFLKGGLPQLVLLVELEGDDEMLINNKIAKIIGELKEFKLTAHITNIEEAKKYWTIRHESFSLLRHKVSGKRTAPFIDDIIVRPEFLPEFLPKLQTILDDYRLIYTIAGHVGDGNFHIIPLLDMTDEASQDIILELSDKVYDLTIAFGGSITAEHNDGIIRTPYLKQMYGEDLVALFQQVKDIFDPLNIFNPGKKVGGTKADIKRYLVGE